jgi:hypothetical protein
MHPLCHLPSRRDGNDAGFDSLEHVAWLPCFSVQHASAFAFEAHHDFRSPGAVWCDWRISLQPLVPCATRPAAMTAAGVG